MTDCTDRRHDLGAYVLGGLDETDTRVVEAHLDECRACRAERDELAELPGLLALADDVPPQVPARVRDRVVAEASRRRGHRRWLAFAAAAAVLSGLLGGLVGWQLAPGPPPALAVPLEAAEPFEATGWAAFHARDGELLLEVELAGLEPLAEPRVYEAWLSTHDERILSIGQLEVEPDGTSVAHLSADGSLEAYRYFWITAEPDRRDPAHDGPTVLAAPVPPSR